MTLHTNISQNAGGSYQALSPSVENYLATYITELHDKALLFYIKILLYKGKVKDVEGWLISQGKSRI